MTSALIDEVRRAGVEVGTLTDDELRLVLRTDAADVTETERAVLDAAARGLVARGWAQAVDDRLELRGGAATVKQASLMARAAIQVRGAFGETPYDVTVVSLGGGAVLVERRESPGVRHYRIDTAGRARAMLVRELAPEAPDRLPENDYAGTDERMQGAIEAARGWLVVLASRAAAEQSTVFLSASAVVDEAGFTWLGARQGDEIRYRAIDRATLRTLLTDWILDEGTEIEPAG
jgi:hypothetical protein